MVPLLVYPRKNQSIIKGRNNGFNQQIQKNHFIISFPFWLVIKCDTLYFLIQTKLIFPSTHLILSYFLLCYSYILVQVSCLSEKSIYLVHFLKYFRFLSIFLPVETYHCWYLLVNPPPPPQYLHLINKVMFLFSLCFCCHSPYSLSPP